MPQIPIPTPIFHFAKFLTDAPISWKIRETETVQLSVFVRDILDVSGRVRIYDLAGAVLATDTIAAQTIDARRMSIMVNPSDLSQTVATIGKIEVWAEVNNARRTEIRTYQIDRTPIRSRAIRVKWINPYGGEDAYTFSAEQEWMLNVEKVRSIQELDMPWSLTNLGIGTPSIFANESGALYSDFERETTIKWLLQILRAPAIWILEIPRSVYEAPSLSEYLARVPIDVTTQNHAWYDKDELLQVKIDFQYSNSILTQNG